MKIGEFKEKYQSQLIAWRRHLHAHPELSWQEYETTKYIIQALKDIGIIEIQTPLDTGVVAIVHGQGDQSNCVALRADIDALPITEETSCEYMSKHAGVMHACGHDVHTTCLLGAAKYLYDHKSEWSGVIKLIFQPSEEKQPSGAEKMIESGVLSNPAVKAIFGLHVTPELEVGKLGFREGAFMASADEIYLTVIGKGGHAASPQLCIDPILISANILVALQQLVSRYADPRTPTVLSFGDIHGSGATNIIPEKVEIKGTLRTFDETWRKEIQAKIKSVCQGIAQSFGGDCIVNIPVGIPFVYNDPELTKKMILQAQEIVGAENVVEMPIRMGAEDFSFYSHHATAGFFRLGTGNNQKGITASVHNPKFDIDEDALSNGAFAMANMALMSLEK